MDASASPSIRASGPWRGGLRLVETLVLTAAIGLSIISFPGPPGTNLDASWQEMLIRAHAQGVQFGRDLVFTWGPWGFLCGSYHLGDTCAAQLLLWKVGGNFLVALALVILTRSVVLWRRIAFAAVFLAFNWFFLDLGFFVLMTLIGIEGLMRSEARAASLVGWALVLGFLAQLKFTYLVVSSAAVLAALACAAGRRSWGRVLTIGMAYAVAVVLAWAAAGQSLSNFPLYVRYSLEIALGYGDAMGADESWPVFFLGAALALSCAGFAWSVSRRGGERCLALPVAGFLAFTMFVMWKEGFTRADGHVMGFFAFILTLVPVVPSLLFPERRGHWFEGAAILCVLGIAACNLDLLRQVPRITWEREYGNSMAIARIGTLPGEWRRAYQQSSAGASRPAISAAVGGASADIYDSLAAVGLLNGLRLTPRPVFQSYSAYTPLLEKLNLRFYQSERAPDFLLWSDDRIDERYPAQDDAMLVAGLPGHYVPLFPENEFWLLKKVSPLSRGPIERRLVYSARVRLYDEIELPPQRDGAVWLQADARPNMLGRVRGILYKPALLWVATTDDQGGKSTWRVLPRIAQDGFILSPTLATGNDMAHFLRGEASSWVKSFHFEAPRDQDEFWSHVDVSVFAMPGLPLKAVLHEGPLVQLGIFDRAPLLLTSVVPTQIIDIPEGRALLLHAKGEAVLGVPQGAARLLCGYGIREGAYMGEGNTDGVDFEVDAIWASGRRQVLWHRYLDPVERAGDRGLQHLDLALPGETPARLELHTDPGPRNDNRWDWSYVCSLRFDIPGAK
jgi:hypothetical protein